jgi:hypothetical protein
VNCLREFKLVTSPERPQYQANEEVESEYINHDSQIKGKTINCLHAERAGRDEHTVAEEITASEYDTFYLYYINEQNLGNCPQVKFR